MACIAIDKNGARCHNWVCHREDNSLTCWSHRHYTPKQHTIRWWKRYFRYRRIFTFLYSKHIEKEILVDLKNGWVNVTPASVARIPVSNLYVDIFTLLCQHGYFKKEWNVPLYQHTLCYMLQRIFWANEWGNEQAWKRALCEIQPYLDVFFKTGTDMGFALQHLPVVTQHSLLINNIEAAPDFLPRWLDQLRDTEAAKELSWNGLQIQTLTEIYKKMPDSPFRSYMCQRFLPDLQELGATEKQKKKVKMEYIKEELLAICWSPERICFLIQQGMKPEDM